MNEAIEIKKEDLLVLDNVEETQEFIDCGKEDNE